MKTTNETVKLILMLSQKPIDEVYEHIQTMPDKDLFKLLAILEKYQDKIMSMTNDEVKALFEKEI